MILRYTAYFYALFFCLIIVSCKNKSNKEQIALEVNHAPLTDSVVGTLTPEQQYYQHFIFKVPTSYQTQLDSFIQWAVNKVPGGLYFDNWQADSVFKVKKSLDTLLAIQPLYMENYFQLLGFKEYPFWETSEHNQQQKWTELLDYNKISLIDFGNQNKKTQPFKKWKEKWSARSGCNFISQTFSDKSKNKGEQFNRFFNTLQHNSDVVKLRVEKHILPLNTYRKITGFNGFFFFHTALKNMNHQLSKGADFLWVEANNNGELKLPYEDWKTQFNSGSEVNESTKRILAWKQKLNQRLGENNLWKSQAKTIRLNMGYGATVLLNNTGEMIPVSGRRVDVFSTRKLKINQAIREASNLRLYQSEMDSSAIAKWNQNKNPKVIIVDPELFIMDVEEIADNLTSSNAVLCFSNVNHYPVLQEYPNLVYFPQDTSSAADEEILLQQLTGHLGFVGDFVEGDSIHQGIKLQALKLAHTAPEFCAVSSDTLKKIDVAVQQALRGRAFPGCQVMLVKDGCIVYDRSFGYHTYERNKKVDDQSVYDLASLTKIVATTMVGMKLYEKGLYKLSDSLKVFLPDSLKDYLKYPSRISEVTFQELFTHQSGLPSGFPILEYMQYTSAEIGRYDRYFCDRPDSVYAIEVADQFYFEKALQDSMWLQLHKLWKDPSKEYRYSDVNMNTLYFMFKSILANNAEMFNWKLTADEKKDSNLFLTCLYEEFYVPLGMDRTRYKPLQYFKRNNIVPTENERYWRKQLLQGYVHDPNAALHGGVAGNAGVFSNAFDLAVLGQMLLNKGQYNGKRYLEAETIEKFTKAQPDSFRGLGFNKPSLNTAAFGCADSAPVETFGHTGFTGTCVWYDPINQMTFIFLSNRVHPKVNNRIYQYGIRANIHQYFYDALLFPVEPNNVAEAL